MKKEYLLAVTAFFFISLSTVMISYAGESSPQKEIIIHKYKKDITGDHKLDSIILKGVQIDESSQYMKKIWAEITLADNVKHQLDFAPGYEPKIEFVDLNHDGVLDLLESSATGGSGGMYNYSLSTFKGGKASEIPLPPPLNIQGHFEDNFQAVVLIPESNFTKKFDLASRKADYIRLGLYQENGKLNEPTELMIDPVAFYKAVQVNEKKGPGLKAYRQVSGAYHADIIGTIIADWYFENGNWQLINVKWEDR